MNNSPKTMKVTLHFHANKYGDEPLIFTSDMSEYGYPHLGTVIGIVQVPQKDPVKAEIEMLEKARDQVRRELSDKLNNIEQRIRELAAIEYKSESGSE